MTFFSSLQFAYPLALIALVSLPALWILLRVTPPRPNTIPFPPLVLIRRLMREESQPSRIPLWLLILRMLIATAIIMAMAGPAYDPTRSAMSQSGPLIIYLETGWPSAPDWQRRDDVIIGLLDEAERKERPVILITDTDDKTAPSLSSPGAVRERLRALQPVSYRPDRKEALAKLGAALSSFPDAELVFAHDGLADEADITTLPQIASALGVRKARLLDTSPESLVAFAGLTNDADGLKLRLLRTPESNIAEGRLVARDGKGRAIGDASFAFSSGTTETEATIKLPTDLRNEISRVEIASMPTAGAIALVDESDKRRRIGIVASTSADLNEPLLAPEYYLGRALEPRADLRLPRQGIADSISTLVNEKVSIIILADIGDIPQDVDRQLQTYLDQGGMIIRFSGPRLANANGALLPVRLRGAGRTLQGALSWETPQRLNPFDRESPFFGLSIPDDVTISRQLLAEPDSDLTRKTWAALTDGTPIVTGEQRGKGMLVLFHVTADTSWSSLPLSGLFLDMLDRLTQLASSERVDLAGDAERPALPPLRILDGFGQLLPPPPNAKPISSTKPARANVDHPAGFYGEISAPFAVNVLDEKSVLLASDWSSLATETLPLDGPKRLDLLPYLLLIAAILFALDGIASLLRARGRSLSRFIRGSAALWLAVMVSSFGADHSTAASLDIAEKDRDAALQSRLAFVITGDDEIDEISRAGLEGLSRALRERTSFEPGDPVAVNISSDDLAVYPLLYWPVTADQTLPTAEAIRRIDRFMKNGGTIIFDTRDASLQRGDGATTLETERLRMILAGLSIPPLEPLPSDHVVTKAFYLIDSIIGRSAEGATWIEALPKPRDGDVTPARAGDGVSPLLITSNDLAAAWAVDEAGDALLPIDATVPRQREMALRAGINVVMYVLTGNYKADQVHIPALLERLGQ